MRTGPPALATWLITRLASGEKRESLIGDLIEQHRHGRSSAWYWRQTISAIVTGFTAEAWRHKGLAIGVVVIGAYLGRIYMFIMRPTWLGMLDGWYPRLISWLFRMEFDGALLLAYRLHLEALTSTITFCAFLALVTWIVSRLHPRQRGLVVSLLLITQVGLCVPYLRIAFTDWLHEPANPMWFFILLRFSIFTFVLIPFSVFWGALCGAGRVAQRDEC
jgi:hypothetical protein